MIARDLHALRIKHVYDALETSPQGLTSEEADRRLALYGLNLLPSARSGAGWRRLDAYARHPMSLLLVAAGGAAALMGQFSLAGVIWLIGVLNVAVSLWQERRAEQAMSALGAVLPALACVVRAGEKTSVPASRIVPGDVLVLAEGDNVPADARVVEEYGLRTNHATLTGSAVPARRTAEASLQESLSELERPNLVFAGTSVASGTARAVVYGTGQRTQFGRIAQLTHAVQERPSLLLQETMRAARVITWLGVVAGVVALIVGVLDLHMPWPEAVLFAIGLVVAIIPEGLLPTVTLSLAMAVQR
ncbi:MAG: cation-transporting P-type ATPase, partial [Anaerolineae bacterium]|nr:cation-transporting P-type ATPase [Anaerolineae bacterium]